MKKADSAAKRGITKVIPPVFTGISVRLVPRFTASTTPIKSASCTNKGIRSAKGLYFSLLNSLYCSSEIAS